ncbi:MAG: chromosomal replication initiator protein DnaA [Lachnospiraceae bacterium]|nr:chromosomal replication initiator protein DnaA [Lachnospiraceae bacterium]
MVNEIRDHWEEILLFIKEDMSLSPVAYETWLKKLSVYSLEGDTLTLKYSGPKNHVDYVTRRYADFVTFGTEVITGIHANVVILTEDDLGRRANPRPSQEPAAPFHETLSGKYTFESFVVGSNNEMAHAASLAVAEMPGEMYNPLFIYGGVGLGKTHLLHAIGNFVLKNDPSAKVLYVTSENFLNELVDSIRGKNGITTTEFRNKYRASDVLLIDDIQFIIGKESMQDEVFHTFDTLYEAKKQIVFSSDRPPKDFATLEERLRSRFERGLTVDIQPPDFETRMAILRKKEEIEGFHVDNEVIKYIATHVKSNIRELEGALTRVVAFSRLMKNREITQDLARDALKDIISPNEERELTMEAILAVVCDHFGVSRTDILSTKRNKEFVYPRQVIMYLSRKLLNVSYQDVGTFLGDRDHTTVIHGENKIEREIAEDPEAAAQIQIIQKKLSRT